MWHEWYGNDAYSARFEPAFYCGWRRCDQSITVACDHDLIIGDEANRIGPQGRWTKRQATQRQIRFSGAGRSANESRPATERYGGGVNDFTRGGH